MHFLDTDRCGLTEHTFRASLAFPTEGMRGVSIPHAGTAYCGGCLSHALRFVPTKMPARLHEVVPHFRVCLRHIYGLDHPFRETHLKGMHTIMKIAQGAASCRAALHGVEALLFFPFWCLTASM